MTNRQKKITIGVVFIVLGLIIGWTVAFVWCLCGGIIDLINFIQGGSVDFWLLIWGVTKVCAATPAGIFIGAFFVIPGINQIDYNL
jgi:hypothetical protein